MAQRSLKHLYDLKRGSKLLFLVMLDWQTLRPRAPQKFSVWLPSPSFGRMAFRLSGLLKFIAHTLLLKTAACITCSVHQWSADRHWMRLTTTQPSWESIGGKERNIKEQKAPRLLLPARQWGMGALRMDQAEGRKLDMPASAWGYTSSRRVPGAQTEEAVKEKDDWHLLLVFVQPHGEWNKWKPGGIPAW